MNEIAKMTHFVNHVCGNDCETCDIKCNYYEIVKQLYDAGYRLQEIDFATNETLQTDDIARIIRTAYSLSPCTSDVAKAIYNAGYRKLNSNAVVMTKDDLKLYKLSIIEGLMEKLKDNVIQCYTHDGNGMDDIDIDDLNDIVKDYLK